MSVSDPIGHFHTTIEERYVSQPLATLNDLSRSKAACLAFGLSALLIFVTPGRLFPDWLIVALGPFAWLAMATPFGYGFISEAVASLILSLPGLVITGSLVAMAFAVQNDFGRGVATIASVLAWFATGYLSLGFSKALWP